MPTKIKVPDVSQLRMQIEMSINTHGVGANLNHLDVSLLTDLSSVFADSPFNGDISEWNVSNVRTIAKMFQGGAFNGDISRWDVSNVRNMDYAFHAGRFTQDLSGWNVAKVESMEGMFQGRLNHPTGLEHWQVGNVLRFFRMFKNNPHGYPLEHWLPRSDAYAMSFLDNAVLGTMAEPCFYHWYDALNRFGPGTQAHDADQEAPSYMTTEQRAHFVNMSSTTRSLGMTAMEGARAMQEQWLRRHAPLLPMNLPELESP